MVQTSGFAHDILQFDQHWSVQLRRRRCPLIYNWAVLIADANGMPSFHCILCCGAETAQELGSNLRKIKGAAVKKCIRRENHMPTC